MDADERLETLINQCKSNDVDLKVDALTKLQAEFEAGIQIPDADALINILRACLRTSNQHLTAATVSTLPSALPLLALRPTNGSLNSSIPSPSTSTSSVAPTSSVDLPSLRAVLSAFLPVGGLIDRLGDREKTQAKAREAIVVLGGLAFRFGGGSSISMGSKGGKGTEPPVAMFERFLREGGLASKVWKVREQSILTLVELRRAHHSFPIRPYLTPLVDALEDTDAHVRDCARQSVVELFSGPGVTDAARADLKKEMLKKNVRKTIVDTVLSKLLEISVTSVPVGAPQSRDGSENGDVKSTGEYVPPSLALKGRTVSGMTRTVSHGSVREIPRPLSRAAAASPIPTPTTTRPPDSSSEIVAVYIASTRDMENEFAAMVKPFEGRESEHNWAQREQAIVLVRGMLKGDVHLRYLDTFLNCLKEGFIQISLKALASLRTTVSVHAASLYAELAQCLEAALDPWVDILLTNLLKMAGFTKKITAQQSQMAVTTLIKHTSGTPRVFIPLFWQTIQEKTVTARTFVVAHVKQYMEIHGHRSKYIIDSGGAIESLEKTIRKALADANPSVRERARECFWIFHDIWLDRGAAILESLDGVARKQLEKACPNPDAASAILPISTPKPTKKTSVAAAIAASRAKAKAIATAPPTLRHQATSGSHVPARRPGSPSLSTSRTSPPAARPSSPLRTSTSPPSRPRVNPSLPSPPTRSVSTSARPTHTRSPSGGPSPPSPDQLSFNRRLSSPLATTPSAARMRQSVSRANADPQPVQLSRNGHAVAPVVYAPERGSILFVEGEESLLLGQSIPDPAGNDSDSDHSMNLMSFSAAIEKAAAAAHSFPKSNSQALSLSPKSGDYKPQRAVSNAMSSDSVGDLTVVSGQPVVEDALRARAEQAESAAERLLELVDSDDDESMQHSTIPLSLLVGSTATNGTPPSKGKPKPSPLPLAGPSIPVTPINRGNAILRQAALFKDSPAPNGRSTSLLDGMRDRKQDSPWWLKRKILLAQSPALGRGDPAVINQQLNDAIGHLDAGTATIAILKDVIHICMANPTAEATSPLSADFNFPASPSPFVAPTPIRSLPSGGLDIWEQNRNFDRLFNALTKFANPSQDDQLLEYSLILLWEMLENQATHLESRETDLFALLFNIRYCNKPNVLEATNTLRDALTSTIEAVYGLMTMHASLKAFQAQGEPSLDVPQDVKSASYAFGLIALGKFILRLPAEIAEEEIPRLRDTLISALSDKSSLVVRESAAAAIICAQLVLRDETHLFTLLSGLSDEKKNLLTYLFDKHGARGSPTGPTIVDKLEKEMRRLDTRISTPPRPTPT